jgi:hypothetical protein
VTKTSDFYSGFEGEPEMRFVLCHDSEEQVEVRAWYGYFVKVIDEVSPVDGRWTGLALPQHMFEGWHEESPWQVPNLREVVEQWRSVPPEKLDSDTRYFHSAVLTLLERALAEDGAVWVYYD